MYRATSYLVIAQLVAMPIVMADDYVVASIEPLRMILSELVGPESARCALPRSASPHTYDPRVADAILTSDADAMFFVAPVFDGWAARLPTRERIGLLDQIPHVRETVAAEHAGHSHGPMDPHFWSDPLVVQQVVPAIARELIRISFGDAEAIESRSIAFQKTLTALDAEINKRFLPLRGKRVIVGHSSWLYFLERYGIEVVGVIEVSPGQELSLNRFATLTRSIEEAGVDAIIAEPQHGTQTSLTLARETGIPLCQIDPIWGGDGTYASLIRENAMRIAEVLE